MPRNRKRARRPQKALHLTHRLTRWISEPPRAKARGFIRGLIAKPLPHPTRVKAGPYRPAERDWYWGKHRTLTAGWLIVLGLLLVTFPTTYQNISTGAWRSLLKPEIADSIENVFGPIRINPELTSEEHPSDPPTRIIIPSRSVDLPVIEAPVIKGYWELSETTASHGVGSANPGEPGNAVIFAHARKGLFLPLRDIEAGETVYVLTRDRWHAYTVTETKLVAPDALEVIAPTNDETLTLFTCTGFLDTKRLIVIAKPATPSAP